MQEWKEKLEVEKKKKPTENERKNKYWERQTESFSSYAILSTSLGYPALPGMIQMIF